MTMPEIKEPKEVWIDADHFDRDGKLHAAHEHRVTIHADPGPEELCYPEGYYRFVNAASLSQAQAQISEARKALEEVKANWLRRHGTIERANIMDVNYEFAIVCEALAAMAEGKAE